MASGYSTLHPDQQHILEELGIGNGAVTQGWGYASASAGYHSPESTFAGKPFSSCMDLSLAALSPDLLNRLVQAGVCPFIRTAATGWSGAEHCHCVTVGLRDGRGNVTILPGPRCQILDWIRGLSGLVGHDAQPEGLGWLQVGQQEAAIRVHYEAWAPDLATGVYRGDQQITCYAWYEFGKVRCDVRRLCEALGGKCTWDGTGAHAFDDQGHELHLPSGRVEVDYYRADVREVAEAFGYQVGFTALQDGTACRVQLTR